MMMTKYIIKISFLLFYFTYLLAFEIEIDNTPVFSINSNQIASVFNDFAGQLEEALKDEDKELKKEKKLKKLKSLKPHIEKEVIKQNGPGFTTVEVREFITNDDKNQISNDVLGNNLILNDPIPFFDEIPMLMIQTKSKKNLKRYDNNAKHPFKIFSDLDKAFDSFFNIDVKTTDNKNKTTEGSTVKITEIKDISHKQEIEKNKINYKDDKLSNRIELTSPQVSLNNGENQKALEKKNYETTNQYNNNNTLIQTTLEIVKEEFESIVYFYYFVKYSIYAIIILIIVCIIKCLFTKILDTEEIINKKEIKKHSINEVEEEFKKLKEKNK